MNKLLILFITLCLSTILCAQSNYEYGYIITNQQDTISGWINLRTNKNNQKRCEFKSDLNLAAKIYLPEDIAGYRFTNSGKYYVSREIRINETSQKVFLEFLVKGIMSLYYYEDEVDYYFFEKPDGKMEIINQQPERIEGMVAYQDNKYKRQIQYLFRDYQSIAQKADKLKFDQESMIGVVEEYHKEVCTTGESCIIFKNEHPDDNGLRCKFSIYTGLQISTYNFDNYTQAAQSKSNASPVLGVQVNLMNPRWSNSISALLDVSFSQFKGNLSKLIYYRYIQYIGIEAPTYESVASSIRLGVKYTYPKYKISPTVEAGPAYTYLKGKNETNFLRHSYFGYYFAAGADYKIKTSHAIFIRLVYENYPFTDGTEIYGNDKISFPHIKAGYTF